MRTTIRLALALLLASGAGAAPPEQDEVRIYVPRTAKVAGENLRLGDVSVVLAGTAALEARVRNVAMGRAPWPKEKLVIDRSTILSRLAACGVDKDSVRFSGASAAAVMRDERTVGTDDLLAAAEKFLQSARPPSKGCIYQVVRKPEELVVDGGGKTELTCNLEEAPGGQIRVNVAATRNGKQLGLREVTYKAMYPIRRAVAIRAIAAGNALTLENVEVQTDYAAQPAQGNWQPPYGLLATRRVAPGTVLQPSMLAEKKPDVQVRRNEMVRLRVEGPGFVITGLGQALQDGLAGETIKVRNVDSKQVITGLIAFDGSVEPVLGR